MNESDLRLKLTENNGLQTQVLDNTEYIKKIQKYIEQFDETKKATCAELERENIQYRLNSGRRIYIENGGKLGRKKGSVKTTEQKEQEYKEVLIYLRKGYGVRVTSKLTNISESTVQRLKKEFGI